MSRPEGLPATPARPPAQDAFGGTPPAGVPGPRGSRYGWFLGLVALLFIALISVNTLSTTPNGATGVAPGQPMPPFAVPTVLGSLNGDADIATAAGQGAAGRRPACAVRGPHILNICQLYERGPVVLALFVAGGSCPAVVDDLERLRPSFPGVQFAAVAIKGSRGRLRSLVRARGWGLPVGYDHDGALANLYKVSSCPQVTFADPGGTVEQKALLTRVPIAALRARVTALTTAARARGWKPPA
jgi:hypothetical protein